MSTFWMIIILLGVAIALYNAYIVWKLSKAVYWILTHVMVLPRGKKDVDYDAIKSMFGIVQGPDDTDADVNIDDIDLDGKE